MALQAKFYYLQVHAHRMVTAAIRHGDLIPPDTCDQCGNPSQIIEGHHHDYSKPLEVVWLCRSCHLKEHGTKSDFHPKRFNASQIVSKYFEDYPDAINEHPRKLAELLEVGKSTVYNYLKAHKGGQ